MQAMIDSWIDSRELFTWKHLLYMANAPLIDHKGFLKHTVACTCIS